MMNRDEMRAYALHICVPLMERTIRRKLAGRPSYKPDHVGYIPADLENFCRPFWGIAPLIAQGEQIVLHAENREISVLDYVRDFLKAGLSHDTENSWDKHKGFMNPYAYENQNITELAGLMIGVFFARKQLWDPMAAEDKQLIADGLYEMAEIAFDHSWPNNHYWFPLFTITVLRQLGFCYARTEEMLEKGLDLLDKLYMGEGWYKDGAFGRFDYYEAWSLHLYPLLWTLIADETYSQYAQRKAAYIERTNCYLDFYTHWFDEKGANVPFGRSLSYRFAACALLPTAVLAGCDIDPALAGRITAMNIGYFKDHVVMEDTHILPEGYWYRSDCVIENYTSDGGAYWCCKAFLALLIPGEHPFWNYENARLPIETENYLVEPSCKDIHMLFEGHDGMVTLYNNTAQYYFNNKLTHKFGDVRSWYSKFVYHSACGFGCSNTDNVAFDSMISLVTEDLSMVSHRLGFQDLGWENGVLHSQHIPFANDKDTTIESFIIPLGGMHVRIHRVKLSRPYLVQEGGYSLGRWDDYYPQELRPGYSCIANHEYSSQMRFVAQQGVELVSQTGRVQPNFHLYAPLAGFPMYITRTPLEAGEYIFAAAFSVDKVAHGKKELPELSIDGSKVTVKVNRSVVFEKEFSHQLKER